MGGGKKKGKLPLTQTLPHTPTGRHRNPHSLRNRIVFPITQAPPSPPIKLHTHTHTRASERCLHVQGQGDEREGKDFKIKAGHGLLGPWWNLG